MGLLCCLFIIARDMVERPRNLGVTLEIRIWYRPQYNFSLNVFMIMCLFALLCMIRSES